MTLGIPQTVGAPRREPRKRGALWAVLLGGALVACEPWQFAGTAQAQPRYKQTAVEVWHGGRRVDATFPTPVDPNASEMERARLARRMLAEARAVADQGDWERAVTIVQWAATLDVAWSPNEPTPEMLLAELRREQEQARHRQAEPQFQAIEAPAGNVAPGPPPEVMHAYGFVEAGEESRPSNSEWRPTAYLHELPTTSAPAHGLVETPATESQTAPLRLPASRPQVNPLVVVRPRSSEYVQGAAPAAPPAGAADSGQASVAPWLLSGFWAGFFLCPICLVALALVLRKWGAPLGPLLRVEVVAPHLGDVLPRRRRGEAYDDDNSDEPDHPIPHRPAGEDGVGEETFVANRRTTVIADQPFPLQVTELTFDEKQRLEQEQARQTEAAILEHVLNQNLALREQLRHVDESLRDSDEFESRRDSSLE